MIPVEVIAHFDIDGKITPYRVRYPKDDDMKIVYICRLLNRSINTLAGNPVEVFDCVAKDKSCEVFFALNHEKTVNKWFLTKI